MKSGLILKKMETGSRPLVPIAHATSMIERTQGLEQLQQIFLSHTLGDKVKNTVKHPQRAFLAY